MYWATAALGATGSFTLVIMVRAINFYIVHHSEEAPSGLLLKHRQRELTVWWGITIFNLVSGIAIGWLLPLNGWPTQDQLYYLLSFSMLLNLITFAVSKWLIPEYESEPYGKHYKHD